MKVETQYGSRSIFGTVPTIKNIIIYGVLEQTLQIYFVQNAYKRFLHNKYCETLNGLIQFFWPITKTYIQEMFLVLHFFLSISQYIIIFFKVATWQWWKVSISLKTRALLCPGTLSMIFTAYSTLNIFYQLHDIFSPIPTICNKMKHFNCANESK